MKKPKSTVRQLVINDPYNMLKAHVFKVYKDRHVTYNQAINGNLVYKSFTRIKTGQGYHNLYQKIKDSGINIVNITTGVKGKA